MPAVAPLDMFDGLRRRLYGGGSSKDERAGVGEEALRIGLRDEDASRLDKRLIDRPAPGAGEADMSRWKGTVDDGRGVRDGIEVLRYPLGVVVPKLL